MGMKKYQKHRHLPAFILLTLARGPAHGGALYTSLCKDLPHFTADTGAIYRTLQQLEEDGAVVFSWDTDVSGPARKIYSITPAGLQQLDGWKSEIELRIQNLKYFIQAYDEMKRG